MLLNEKRTTVAYRCPHCGAGVMSAVGLFNLSADMVKLKCTCGHSEMKIVYNRDGTVRLTVPCLLCNSPHTFTVKSSVFFSEDLFVLPCPYSDINICFTGEINHVKAELARTELELLDILEANGITDFSAFHGDEKDLSDPQILDIILFVINDLDAEGKIFCRCHPDPALPLSPDEGSAGEGKGTSAREDAGTDENENGCGCECPSEGECDARHGNGNESGNGNEGECEGESESRYEATLTEEGIVVTCKTCGATRVIPTDSLLSAHAFLNADSLHLD